MVSFLTIGGSRTIRISKPIWRSRDSPTLAPRKPIQIMAYFGICSDQGKGANKTYLQNTPQFTITAMMTNRIEAVINIILSETALSFSINARAVVYFISYILYFGMWTAAESLVRVICLSSIAKVLLISFFFRHCSILPCSLYDFVVCWGTPLNWVRMASTLAAISRYASSILIAT